MISPSDNLRYYVYPIQHEAEKSLLDYHKPPYCLAAAPVKTTILISGQSVAVYELTEADFRLLRDKCTSRDYYFFESATGVVLQIINMRHA